MWSEVTWGRKGIRRRDSPLQGSPPLYNARQASLDIQAVAAAEHCLNVTYLLSGPYTTNRSLQKDADLINNSSCDEL